MIEKIKDINPSIPGMLIVQLLYLIVGETLILGMFSMKVAAYIQPFTDKLINKIKKGR